MKLYVAEDSSEDDSFVEDDECVADVYFNAADKNILGLKRKAMANEVNSVEVDQLDEIAQGFGSDSDSFDEWEDVIPLSKETEDNFIIRIGTNEEERQKRSRRLQIRRKRLAIRNLSLVVYIAHGYKRNELLNSKRVHKALKLVFPVKMWQRSKQFWKSIKKTTDKDLLRNELQYILKYVMKWIVHNFKVTSNGLRVLGYLPEGADGNDHFPNTAKEILGLLNFTKEVKNLQNNRDFGAQMVTALLRMLKFDARMIFSLPTLPLKDIFQPPLDHEKLSRNMDNDLLYPYFWTEVVNPLNNSEILIVEAMCFHNPDHKLIELSRFNNGSGKSLFTDVYYPVKDQFNQMNMEFVLAFTPQNTVFDVSPRYMPDTAYKFFKTIDLRTVTGRSTLIIRSVLRYLNLNKNLSISEELQALETTSKKNVNLPSSFAAMKKSPNYITNSTLRFNEIIQKGSRSIGKVKIQSGRKFEKVYFKDSIVVGKSEQQWRMLGRCVVDPKHPIKTTKERPRTLWKRRKLNLDTKENGPQLMNLYSFEQTEMIQPPIIAECLPKNIYGNIEIFKSWMQPKETAWLKLSDIEQILSDFNGARKLFAQDRDSKLPASIDFVTVIVGFDFKIRPGNAVPIKSGVLVRCSDAVTARRIWIAAKLQIGRVNEEKRKLRGLTNWRKMLKLLQIQCRLDEHHL